MSGPIYMTIDLDYWNSPAIEPFSLNNTLKIVAELKVPVYMCADHSAVLTRVNRSEARHLINVDYHSDIDAEPPGNDPNKYTRGINCGNWVNHVYWKHQKGTTYEWRHPKSDPSDGYCHGEEYFTKSPFKGRRWRTWDFVKKKQGLEGILWDKVTEVCLALSPDYLLGKAAEAFCLHMFPEHRKEFLSTVEGKSKYRTYQCFYSYLYTKLIRYRAFKYLEPLKEDAIHDYLSKTFS